MMSLFLQYSSWGWRGYEVVTQYLDSSLWASILGWGRVKEKDSRAFPELALGDHCNLINTLDCRSGRAFGHGRKKAGTKIMGKGGQLIGEEELYRGTGGYGDRVWDREIFFQHGGYPVCGKEAISESSIS
ncbi:hypothetical protein JTB14_017061 [Gonioctena quinquepunctata]|nr:hypothetical protein JTB14_017061 [Gonioctena quinquepunctata]